MGKGFREQLEIGHESRRYADEIWSERDCENYYQKARIAYEAAYHFAHKKEQRTVAGFFKAICSYQISWILKNAEVQKEEEVKRYENEFNQYFHQATRYSHPVLVKVALSEARNYGNRYLTYTKAEVSRVLTKLLYRFAKQIAKKKKKKAKIAFKYGQWCVDASDFDQAKKEFDFCEDLGIPLKGFYYQIARMNSRLAETTNVANWLECYQSACDNLRRHLQQYPEDHEARNWLHEMEQTYLPANGKLNQENSTMTNPTGRSFLSYRRARSAEAALLIAAQRDRGIPTWQDIHNLNEEPLEETLRSVINDPTTANAVLLLTPEVADSVVIQRIEAPPIIARAKRGEGFFVIPVLAGGLDFADADKAVDPAFAMEDLRNWSLLKAAKDPLDAAEAARIANRVLQRRLATIHLALPKDDPLRLNLSTRKRQAWQPGTALLMDWSERFSGREAVQETWQDTLLPALEDVASAIEQFAPGRVIEANGVLSLPAAAALGCTFLATRRLPIAWRQYTPGRAEQVWSLDTQRELSGFQGVTKGADTGADELAVLVMVNDNNVRQAFYATKDLPNFRAITEVSNPNGIRHDLSTPGLAADVAFMTTEAIRKARDEYRPIRKLHLFMSVPAGLAMMIGQLLNTVGQVQTYEHIAEENIYRPAALLHPAD